MNNSMQVFAFNDSMIRTMTEEGETLFRASDVAAVLGLETHVMLRMVEEDDRIESTVIDSLGRNQRAVFLREAGLYTVLLRSNKPEAAPFRRWVTREVLPQIRKTGHYGKDQPVRLSPEDRESIRYEIMALILSEKSKPRKPKALPPPPPVNEWTDHEWIVVCMLKRKFQDGVRFMRNRDLVAASHSFQKITKARQECKMYEKLEKKGMIEIYKGRYGGLCFGMTHKILELKR